MKILYILHSTIMGGATISFLNMIAGLGMRGVEAVVVLPNRDDVLEAKLREQNAEVRICPLVFSIWGKDRGKTRKRMLFLPRILKKEYKKWRSLTVLCRIVEEVHPDIIHTNTGVVHEGYRAARKYGIPHVWHLREYQDRDFNWEIYPSKKCFERYLNDSYVITITEDILRHFRQDGNNHALTIYNGIMSRDDVRQDWPKQKYFLCASRIGPEKGHEDTISAFAEFHKSHPDFRLCILGFGKNEYIEKLKRLSVDLGCDAAIDWIGFQPEVAKYMRKATALIVASHYEGFGRMTAEACFCGSVVIGRNTGGTKEILDRTGGLLFDDVETLRNRMEEVAAWTRTQYVPVAEKAQKVAVDLYSTEANVNQVCRLYEGILEP